MSILETLKRHNYRIGRGQAIIYNKTKTDIFSEGFLGELYFKFKGTRFSGRQENENSILETMFCGMPDVSFNAIVPYLATRLPLVVAGVWQEKRFTPVGIGFPTVICGAALGQGDQRACFYGYGFLPEWWGSEEIEPLSMLALALTFQELNLLAIHGLRYDSNDLTARFTRRLGFKDVAKIPHYMLKRGKLVGATLSSLTREDFEAYVERALLQEFGDESDSENPGQSNLFE